MTWLLEQALTLTQSFRKGFHRRCSLNLNIIIIGVIQEKKMEGRSRSKRQKIKRVGKRRYVEPKDLKNV